MQAKREPSSSLVLSLLGGGLILAGGVTMLVVRQLVSSPSEYPSLRSLIAMGYETMKAAGFAGGLAYESAVVSGVVSGGAVLYAATMAYMRPAEVETWGTVVIAFSFVSLIGVGGFGIGAIFGILGGATMFTWKDSLYRTLRRKGRRTGAAS